MPSWIADDSGPHDPGGGSPDTIADQRSFRSVRRLFQSDSALVGYEPIRSIGMGGMGTVISAREISTDRVVALKVVATLAAHHDLPVEGKNSQRRFEVEVRATACLQHPNIVPIYSVGHGSGFSFYTMRLIEGVSVTHLLFGLAQEAKQDSSASLSVERIGETLNSICEARQRSGLVPAATASKETAWLGCDPDLPSTSLALRAAADAETSTRLLNPQVATASEQSTDSGDSPSKRWWTRQDLFQTSAHRYFASRIADIADALQYAYDEGIVHRDVKPSNILIDREGCFYLADFGLAKFHDPHGDQSTACVGTPGYIAPERLHGDNGTDPRSDVFALGLVLEQLATLSTKSPLRDPPLQSMERARGLARVPRQLRRIIHAATADDVNQRYQNAAEFAEDLRRFARREPPRLNTGSGGSALARPFSNLWLRRTVVASIAVAVLVLLTYAFQEVRRQRRDRLDAELRARETVALFLDSLDKIYQTTSNQAFQASLADQGPISKLPIKPIDPMQRRQLLDGLEVSYQLAQKNPNDAEAILRIAQTARRAGYVLQISGYGEDADRLYDDAENMLAGLEGVGLDAAVELCWLAYHRASSMHRQKGYRHSAKRYHSVFEIAEPFLAQAPSQSDAHARLHEVIGMTSLAQQNFPVAIEHLEQVTSGELSSASHQVALATAYRMVGRYQDALPIIRACVDRDPENSECLRNLAAIQMHLDRVDEASDSYERCLEIDPRNELALQGLAWARHRQGKTAEAIEWVDRAIDLSPNHEIILTARGVFLAAEQRFDESLRDLIEAYRLRPSSGYVAEKLFPALLFFPNADESTKRRAQDLVDQHGRTLPPSTRTFVQALIDCEAGRYCRAAEGLEAMRGLPNRSGDPRIRTLWYLCECRCDPAHQVDRIEALEALQHQRDIGWPGFGISPFDQAMLRHVEDVLDETLLTDPLPTQPE